MNSETKKSNREGKDAMSQQRLMVMQLLGDTTGELEPMDDEPLVKEEITKDPIKEANITVVSPPCAESNFKSDTSDSEFESYLDRTSEHPVFEVLNKTSINLENGCVDEPGLAEEVYDNSSLLSNSHPCNGTTNKEKFDNDSINENSETIESLISRAQAFIKNRVISVNEEESVLNGSTSDHSIGKTSETTSYNFKNPRLALDYSECFQGDNIYTKGCKWSPDGEFLLSLSNIQKFSLFRLPESLKCDSKEDVSFSKAELQPSYKMTEGELVYDYHWYPHMDFNDPSTCCFVASCRGMPVHLWNLHTSTVTHSYRPFNHLDEIAPAYSLGFSRDGDILVCGFKRAIRYFNTSRPGRDCTTICAKRQNGIISCFDFHPHLHNVLAAGSYLGNIGLYNLENNKLFSLLEGQRGGVTQILFSDDGYRLFAGARRDNELLCWDIRNLGNVLSSHERQVDSNQRIAFALSNDAKNLVSGSTCGSVLTWNLGLQSTDNFPMPSSSSFEAHKDCVNGISIHPQYPLLATSSGRRRVKKHPFDDETAQEDSYYINKMPASVRVWRL